MPDLVPRSYRVTRTEIGRQRPGYETSISPLIKVSVGGLSKTSYIEKKKKQLRLPKFLRCQVQNALREMSDSSKITICQSGVLIFQVEIRVN